ncbi:MAG TPA: hypothetical protein VHO24_12025 [Opitutaceae bacterium]|nr:hypothetical protein [Opitutaceae bacterium]
MEIYLPTLETKMTDLVVVFRFIVFAIMVAGFIFSIKAGRTSGSALTKPLFKAIVIVAAVATLDLWFPKVESVFLSVAEYIDPGFTKSPASSANTIRESTTTNPEGKSWSWRHLNESVYQAVTSALANVFIYIGTLITVPMLILQYILRWLLYLLAPFALAFFMVPGFSGIGVRFFQQVLAIMAWPVGFALTNLVALAVWNDFRAAVGANPPTVGEALYSPLLTAMGGILATIIIVVGMISTPLVMQKLFAQGAAFTGTSVNPVSIVRGGAGMIQGAGARLSSRGASAAPSATAASAPMPPPMGAGARPGI